MRRLQKLLVIVFTWAILCIVSFFFVDLAHNGYPTTVTWKFTTPIISFEYTKTPFANTTRIEMSPIEWTHSVISNISIHGHIDFDQIHCIGDCCDQFDLCVVKCGLYPGNRFNQCKGKCRAGRVRVSENITHPTIATENNTTELELTAFNYCYGDER